MIEPRHPSPPVARQCTLIGISWSTWYGSRRGESALNLTLMRLIDAQFLETPFHGSRQMARHPRNQGHCVGRKRVRRLMAKMGLRAVYQRPRTSVPHPEHKVWPYLLRRMAIDRPNQDRPRRHQLHSDATRVSLPCRDHGLGAPAGAVLAAVEYLGGGILYRGPRGRHGPSWLSRDLQHGSGQPIHQPALHRNPDGGEGEDLHGRARTLDRQRHDRASMAVTEIRVRLSPTPSRPGRRPRPGSAGGSPSITSRALIRRSAEELRSRPTKASASKRRRDQRPSLATPRNCPGNGDHLSPPLLSRTILSKTDIVAKDSFL